MVGGSRIVRSRHVAMEFAWDTRYDAFAGTPPLKAVRLGLALAVVLVGPSGRKKMMVVGLYDVSVALYHAVMDQDIHVIPPRGEEEEGWA